MPLTHTKPKPLFIVFEGGEGSGKSTQIKKLSYYLQQKNIVHISSREPGGCPSADKIRSCIVESFNNADPINSLTELLLIQAARSEHVEKTLEPALKNKHVLCDRYIYSSLAYQAGARHMDTALVEQLNALSTNNLLPDKVVLLDIPPELGLQRSKQRLAKTITQHKEDRFEQEALAFHQSVRQNYLKLAKNNADRFIVIDANQDETSIHQSILHHLEPLLCK